jgi:hypothetical protein
MISKRTGLLEAIKVPSSPFPGLRPFEFQESHLFFGRDGQIEKLLDKLTRTRFLAVVGTSGSGKSSLARAGMMPALRGGIMTGAGSNWRIAVMRPSNDPIGNLARALNAPDVFGSDDTENAAIQIAVAEATLRLGSRGLIETVRQNVMPETENLLVVVDQFEELFRFAREARKAKDEGFDNDAAAFVKLLLEAVKPGVDGQREANIYVVLTMRSDFLGDCSQFWDLPEAINESQYLIPRLTRDQLREVIEGPIAVGAGAIAPRLVNQLLNDIGDDQDQLPILQHALMRAWNEWKQPRHEHQSSPAVIDICCYDATGRMAEALSRHADEACNELDEAHRKIAEKMFKSLTERGEDNREIRRPATLTELAAVANVDEDEVKTVIETFRHPGRSLLMPPAENPLHSDTLIDISHESLIRVWNQLQQWVNEEAESATVYRRLLETALLRKGNRSELWRGADLQVGLEWQTKNQPTEAWAKRYSPAQDEAEHGHSSYETAIAFLLASEQKRLEEEVALMLSQRDEAERAKRELAQVQALAEAQTRAAETEKQRADEQARAAYRLRRLTAALVVIASLAAIAAFSALWLYQKANAESQRANQQKDEAQKARNEAIEQRAKALAGEEGAKKAAAEAERQKGIAEKQTLIAQQQTRAANAATEDAKKQKEEVQTARNEAIEQRAKALAGEERAIKAAAEAERQKGIAEKQTLIAQQQTQAANAATEDAKKQKAFADSTAYAANMNLAGAEFERGNAPRGYALLDNYLPALDAVATKADLRSFYWYYLWREKHHEQSTIEGHKDYVWSVAFSPDGRTLASTSYDRTIKLWDVASRQELKTLEGHKRDVRSVAF